MGTVLAFAALGISIFCLGFAVSNLIRAYQLERMFLEQAAHHQAELEKLLSDEQKVTSWPKVPPSRKVAIRNSGLTIVADE